MDAGRRRRADQHEKSRKSQRRCEADVHHQERADRRTGEDREMAAIRLGRFGFVPPAKRESAAMPVMVSVSTVVVRSGIFS